MYIEVEPLVELKMFPNPLFGNLHEMSVPNNDLGNIGYKAKSPKHSGITQILIVYNKSCDFKVFYIFIVLYCNIVASNTI